jgi:hypothetical protein
MEQHLQNTLCGAVVSSDLIDCDCRHFHYTCWAIQLHVGVAKLQDSGKFVDPPLGCNSRGVNVNDATHTVITFAVSRLGVFSVAFNTVFQAFLTTFLIDSGYKTPIQNMDELFASGLKLAYPSSTSFIFESGDETDASNVQRNAVICLSFEDCIDWVHYHKNISI